MLLIPCPFCGERDECEFRYGGAATKLPEIDPSESMESWHQAIHVRKNPDGKLREYWYHESGCEQWFEIERDTCTHEIFSLPVNRQFGKNDT